MPEHHIYPSARLAWLRWGADPVTPERFDAMLARLFADPAFEPGLRILSDRRQAPTTQTVAYVNYLAESFARHRDRLGTSRWAVVIPPNGEHDAMFGMARMTEVLADSVEYRVFRKLDAALEWLGVPPDTLS